MSWVPSRIYYIRFLGYLILTTQLFSSNVMAQSHNTSLRAIPVAQERQTHSGSCLSSVTKPGPLLQLRATEVSSSKKPLIHLPISLIIAAGWGLMNEQQRKNKIVKTIINAANDQSIITQELTPNEIEIIAQKTADEFASKQSKEERKDDDRKISDLTLNIEKSATLSFVEQIFEKTLTTLKLPCSSTDISNIVRLSLSEFKTCLDSSSKSDQFLACINEVTKNGAYKIGHLSLQVLLKDMLKDQNLSSEQLNQLNKTALDKYNQCAQNHLINIDSSQVAYKLKLCVSSSALEAVRTLANKTIKDSFIKQGFTDVESENELNQIISSIDPSQCPLHTYFKNELNPNSQQLQPLEKYFSNGKDNLDQLKLDAYNCVNHIAKASGKQVLPKVLAKETAIQDVLKKKGKALQSTSPHLSHEEALKQVQEEFQKDVINNSYNPCVERLHSKNPLSIIDPLECEDTIRAQVGASFISSELSAQLTEAFKSLPPDKSKTLSDAASKQFQLCKNQKTTPTEAGVIDCLKVSLESTLSDYAIEMADIQLEDSIKKVLPTIHDELRARAKQCVQYNFSSINKLQDVVQNLETLKIDCSKKLSQYLAPHLATYQVDTKFKSQKIDPTDFKTNHMNPILADFHKSLDEGKDPEKAVHDLNKNLSWEAFSYVANHKIDEYFPLSSFSELNAQLKKTHTDKTLELDFKSTHTSEELESILDKSQDSLILSLASNKMDVELKQLITDAKQLFELKQKQLSSLKKCLDDPLKAIETCILDTENSTAISVLESQLGQELPEGISVTEIMKPALTNQKTCLSKLNDTDSDYELQHRKCQIDLIVDSIEAGAQSITNKTIENYKTQLDSTLIESMKTQISTHFRKCIQSQSIEKLDTKTSNFLKNCAQKSSLFVGTQIAQSLAPNYTLENPPAAPINPSSLDTFVYQSLSTCVKYRLNNCSQNLNALHDTFQTTLQQKSETMAAQTLLDSPFGQQMIYANIGSALETELMTVLKPHQHPTDKSNHIDYVIRDQIGSPYFVEKVLNNPEGKALIQDVKTKMIQDTSYNPTQDIEVQNNLKKILVNDNGDKSFTDLAFEAVASSAYYERLAQASESKIQRHALNDVSINFHNVLKTPFGIQARDLFRNKILIPFINNQPPTKNEIDAIQKEIETLLMGAKLKGPLAPLRKYL